MRTQVLDKQRLARVCQQVERWEGSWTQAAARLRIGVATFGRLRAGAPGQLNATTFDALYRYLPPDRVSPRALAKWTRDLFKAVLSTQDMTALNTYIHRHSS